MFAEVTRSTVAQFVSAVSKTICQRSKVMSIFFLTVVPL